MESKQTHGRRRSPPYHHTTIPPYHHTTIPHHVQGAVRRPPINSLCQSTLDLVSRPMGLCRPLSVYQERRWRGEERRWRGRRSLLDLRPHPYDTDTSRQCGEITGRWPHADWPTGRLYITCVCVCACDPLSLALDGEGGREGGREVYCLSIIRALRHSCCRCCCTKLKKYKVRKDNKRTTVA